MVPNVLDALDDAALDALPFGAIALDVDGRIARYNQVEARRANVSRWTVIGRNFLREVAWTLGPGAAMRIRGVLSGSPGASFRARDVTVTLRRRPGGGAWLIVEPYFATTMPNVSASC